MASRLSFADLPFMQGTQQGNPYGIVPSSYAFGSISNMLYTAVMAGAAGNSINVTHQPAEFDIPTEPVTPTFSGTVHTVTSEATFNSALTAAADGDILEIPANTTVTFTGQKTIRKSICLRGQNRTTSKITSSFNVPANQALIQIAGTKVDGAQNNNVYVHTLTITSSNNSQDHAVLSASTVSTAFNNGSSGIRFENLTLFTTEICISVAANAWAIKGCEFNYTPAGGAADTARHIYVGNIGVMGWVENCVFNCTTEATPRTIGVLLFTPDYEFAPATKSGGFSGDLVLKGNSQGTGNLRQWFVMESFKANGLNSAPMAQDGFSLWAVNNSHNNTSGGSFIFYAGAGVSPLSFFDTLYFAGNNCGESTGTDKGLIAVDGLGTLRSAGAPEHLYVAASSVNTGTSLTAGLTRTASVLASNPTGPGSLLTTSGSTTFNFATNSVVDTPPTVTIQFGGSPGTALLTTNTPTQATVTFGSGATAAVIAAAFSGSLAGVSCTASNGATPLQSGSSGSPAGTPTALSAGYVQGCTDTVGGSVVSPSQGNLLAVNNVYFNSPSPASRLSVEAAAGTFAVNVVGNAVTVSVAPSTPATSLASSLNANGTFAALVSATASDGNNASTSGSVTLSGGAG